MCVFMFVYVNIFCQNQMCADSHRLLYINLSIISLFVFVFRGDGGFLRVMRSGIIRQTLPYITSLSQLIVSLYSSESYNPISVTFPVNCQAYDTVSQDDKVNDFVPPEPKHKAHETESQSEIDVEVKKSFTGHQIMKRIAYKDRTEKLSSPCNATEQSLSDNTSSDRSSPSECVVSSASSDTTSPSLSPYTTHHCIRLDGTTSSKGNTPETTTSTSSGGNVGVNVLLAVGILKGIVESAPCVALPRVSLGCWQLIVRWMFDKRKNSILTNRCASILSLVCCLFFVGNVYFYGSITQLRYILNSIRRR